MIPGINEGTEWEAHEIADRWLRYLPDIFPHDIKSVLVSGYQSEMFKRRKAIKFVNELMESGKLATQTVTQYVKKDEDYRVFHPLYGSLPGTRTITKEVTSNYVIGLVLTEYEASFSPTPAPTSLSGNVEAQKNWINEYIMERGINAKEDLPDEIMKIFREEAYKVGMTENSFKARCRELSISGIDRRKLKK